MGDKCTTPIMQRVIATACNKAIKSAFVADFDIKDTVLQSRKDTITSARQGQREKKFDGATSRHGARAVYWDPEYITACARQFKKRPQRL